MVVIKNNNPSCFDCDGTLVIWPKNPNIKRKGHIKFNYGGEIVYLKPHKSHIRLLKHYHERGDWVEVRSKNGFEWAEQVVLKLGLKPYVNIAGAKFNRSIDDATELADICGNRVFLGEE